MPKLLRQVGHLLDDVLEEDGMKFKHNFPFCIIYMGPMKLRNITLISHCDAFRFYSNSV